MSSGKYPAKSLAGDFLEMNSLPERGSTLQDCCDRHTHLAEQVSRVHEVSCCKALCSENKLRTQDWHQLTQSFTSVQSAVTFIALIGAHHYL